MRTIITLPGHLEIASSAPIQYEFAAWMKTSMNLVYQLLFFSFNTVHLSVIGHHIGSGKVK